MLRGRRRCGPAAQRSLPARPHQRLSSGGQGDFLRASHCRLHLHHTVCRRLERALSCIRVRFCAGLGGTASCRSASCNMLFACHLCMAAPVATRSLHLALQQLTSTERPMACQTHAARRMQNNTTRAEVDSTNDRLCPTHGGLLQTSERLCRGLRPAAAVSEPCSVAQGWS